MKISNCLFALAVLVVGFGCRSADMRGVSTASSPPQTVQNTQDSGASRVQQGSTGDFDYTIETIPNTRLSATSREGDSSTAVYSSNIIAVYVHPHNGVTGTSTNSPAVPNQENTTESPRK